MDSRSPQRPAVRALTVRLIEMLPPGETLRDAKVRGFFVERGKRQVSFKVQGDLRRSGRRESVRITLGHYPELTLDAARSEAMRLLSDIHQGVDPRAPSVAKPASWTVGSAIERYLADLAVRERAPLTIEYAKGRLTTHLKEWLELPLTSIRPSQCQSEHARISAAIGKVAANNTLRDFRAVYNFARRKIDDPDSLRTNPVESVTMHPERRREAVIYPDDITSWHARIMALTNPLRREMHLLGLFSGLRPGNLVSLRRDWLDLRRHVVMIPAPQMKGRREFHLPLSDHMTAIVQRALHAGDVLFPGSPWVFPTRAANGRDVIATQVWKERSLPSETGHILRHTWRTLAVAAGVVGNDAEMLLAHRIAGVEGVYIHSRALFDHLRTCQERVTDHILRLIGTSARA